MNINKFLRLIRMSWKKRLFQIILCGFLSTILQYITGMPFGMKACIMKLWQFLGSSEAFYTAMPAGMFDGEFIFSLWILWGLMLVAFNPYTIYPFLIKLEILDKRFYARKIRNPWRYGNNIVLFAVHYIEMCVIYSSLLINVILTYEYIAHRI